MKKFLRKFKPLYWVYNLFHYADLKHNRTAFKKYNIHKPLFGSLSSRDFPDTESQAWLDKGDSELLAPGHPGFPGFPDQLKEKILNWSRNGYIILEKFFDAKTCDSINCEIERLMDSKKLRFENKNKLMFANRKSRLIKDTTKDPGLKKILSFILGKEIVPFQTINFMTGSEQRGHSDSIHMTTYPLGYLIAVWIALEDVHTDNGPLFYYPGSHKLPYVLNNSFNEGDNLLFTGKKEYKDYEDVMEESVINMGFKKETFLARKGDVFIWHANLVHGGAPITNRDLTRKSMVIHYFANDVIKYHEITERPSLLKI